MNLSEYFTITEVEAYFGISRTAIIYAVKKGLFDVHFFDGRKRMFHKSQVEKMKTRWRPRKKKVRQLQLKPGLYYSIGQVATMLRLTESIIRNAIRRKLIKVDYIDGRKSIIHQDEVDQFKMFRELSSAQAKREAQLKLSELGFTYSRNPPPGAPRGSSRNPSPLRRGWSKDGVYYGLTAVEALRQWQQSLK